jgi:D-alanyl-D-alanine carboxypeptidase/D-alanyl-D-alanine-endopeptidase (penicillin-binding protein 4)
MSQPLLVSLALKTDRRYFMQFVLSLLLCCAAPLASEATPEIDAYLKSIHEEIPEFAARLAAVARKGIGTPYHDGPLGEGPDGAYDRDPLIDLTRVDCVTYVEQTIALAACPSYEAAFAKLQEIRYQGGQVDFETRNHFMIADWIPNNPWVRDVTSSLGVELESATRTISKRAFFPLVKAPELGQDTADQSITIEYVPIARLAEAIPKLPSPALILLIGAKPDWLFVLHCGIFLREEDGTGRMYHASSKAGEVVAQDLEEYLKDSTRYLGIQVYAIDQP